MCVSRYLVCPWCHPIRIFHSECHNHAPSRWENSHSIIKYYHPRFWIPISSTFLAVCFSLLNNVSYRGRYECIVFLSVLALSTRLTRLIYIIGRFYCSIPWSAMLLTLALDGIPQQLRMLQCALHPRLPTHAEGFTTTEEPWHIGARLQRSTWHACRAVSARFPESSTLLPFRSTDP